MTTFVSEELNSVETWYCNVSSPCMEIVSEELNSVETTVGVLICSIDPTFQKNLIVWKPTNMSSNIEARRAFQKNLIVWKLSSTTVDMRWLLIVSEELNSVETTKYGLYTKIMNTGFRRT